MSKARRVYPVEGYYIQGVPHVAHLCDDEFCVESGAFTTKRPPEAPEPDEAEEAESTEEA